MRPFLLAFLVFGCTAVLPAQGSPRGKVLRGYVVDASCGAAMAGKPNAVARAARHTRACALDEQCAASGYGMFADGVWVPFDAKGNALAKAAIAASKKERGHFCEVKGSMEGELLAVESLREVAAGK